MPTLTPSIRETARGWQLAFDPNDTVASQAELNSDHWADWLASSCPALLIGGSDSRVPDAAHLKQMASRRANTQLIMLKGGHVVHFDNLEGFTSRRLAASSATSRQACPSSYRRRHERFVRLRNHPTMARCQSRFAPALFAANAEWRKSVGHARRSRHSLRSSPDRYYPGREPQRSLCIAPLAQ